MKGEGSKSLDLNFKGAKSAKVFCWHPWHCWLDTANQQNDRFTLSYLRKQVSIAQNDNLDSRLRGNDIANHAILPSSSESLYDVIFSYFLVLDIFFEPVLRSTAEGKLKIANNKTAKSATADM